MKPRRHGNGRLSILSTIIFCAAVLCHVILRYILLIDVNCCYFFVSIQHHADHFSKKNK